MSIERKRHQNINSILYSVHVVGNIQWTVHTSGEGTRDGISATIHCDCSLHSSIGSLHAMLGRRAFLHGLAFLKITFKLMIGYNGAIIEAMKANFHLHICSDTVSQASPLSCG